MRLRHRKREIEGDREKKRVKGVKNVSLIQINFKLISITSITPNFLIHIIGLILVPNSWTVGLEIP